MPSSVKEGDFSDSVYWESSIIITLGIHFASKGCHSSFECQVLFSLCLVISRSDNGITWPKCKIQAVTFHGLKANSHRSDKCRQMPANRSVWNSVVFFRLHIFNLRLSDLRVNWFTIVITDQLYYYCCSKWKYCILRNENYRFVECFYSTQASFSIY